MENLIKTYDVGSLPPPRGFEKIVEATSQHSFEKIIIRGFIDKAEAGVDIPNFPQFRDMNKMFLTMIKGLERVGDGYIETGSLSLHHEEIPEALAIKSGLKEIYERLNRSFEIKICITGPYTLSSQFIYKNKETFRRLGEVLSRIIEKNVFRSRYGEVSLVAIDEPLFGVIEDPLMDRGSEARENLLKAWENMLHKAKSLGAKTIMHLHSTTDELFWEIDSLDIVESHVGDYLYQTDRTKRLLEARDKFLKASISISEFDTLIRERIKAISKDRLATTTLDELVTEAWKNITRGKIDPKNFLEDTETIKKRLMKVIERFGAERVPFAGPECGLRGFPSYECAIECLRRVSEAVKELKIQ